MDENLARLTQKTEEPKGNEGNFTFPTQRVIVIANCNVIKKSQSPISTSTSPFQVYPPIIAKNLIPPQVAQFLEGPTPILIRGGFQPWVKDTFFPQKERGW